MYQYMLWYEAHHFNLSDFKSKFGFKRLKMSQIFGGMVITWVYSRWT